MYQVSFSFQDGRKQIEHFLCRSQEELRRLKTANENLNFILQRLDTPLPNESILNQIEGLNIPDHKLCWQSWRLDHSQGQSVSSQDESFDESTISTDDSVFVRSPPKGTGPGTGLSQGPRSISLDEINQLSTNQDTGYITQSSQIQNTSSANTTKPRDSFSKPSFFNKWPKFLQRKSSPRTSADVNKSAPNSPHLNRRSANSPRFSEGDDLSPFLKDPLQQGRPFRKGKSE